MMLGKEKITLFGLGLMAGTFGLKLATSKTAKKAYVKTLATGLKAKAECDKMIEEAKANVDDIMAEAKLVSEHE
ncbi:uncharacterized protein DUF1490 [Desulfitobacterium sp. LBE]|uniref:DUF1490 domain-containing protein n=4 Tax=root TaxID=1 RepID=A0A098B5J3_DESHA|nr:MULTISPECIES: DUF6110 family protein [Desulfitobacterium]ACL19983.1 conserved hypothetical protein [Desulfitobacterium hafniense DCB-2]TWH57202.1 uncharacterized protein DUF1490 [Desulfitobacterium sp. LBE]CDX03660.1 Hypothetical protein DPCES_3774 [Desulfitobacterium hafniense]